MSILDGSLPRNIIEELSLLESWNYIFALSLGDHSPTVGLVLLSSGRLNDIFCLHLNLLNGLLPVNLFADSFILLNLLIEISC